MSLQAPPQDPNVERVERRRKAPAAVALAAYRLVRAQQLYDDGNAAVEQQVGPLLEAVRTYVSLFSSPDVRLLFAGDVVFVNRRLLRAPKELYAHVLELGALLERAQANELCLTTDAARGAVLQVLRALLDAQRDASARERLRSLSVPGCSVRTAPTPNMLGADSDESAMARLLKAYAASILIVQRFYRELARGEGRGAHEARRVAHKLVALVEDQPELLVAIATGRFMDGDPARLAVSTAVIALEMTRQLTHDRGVLGTLASAALLAHVGALRLGRDATAERLSASALVELSVLGRYHVASLKRTMLAAEALDPQRRRGSVSLPGILRMARRLSELRAPEHGTRGRTLGEAYEALEAETTHDEDHTTLRLLVGALGFYPPQTVVQLSTGEVAVVTGVPASALDFARPRVRIVSDASQSMLSRPLDVDLARPSPGAEPRAVVRHLSLSR
jgi:hypothetical protein